MNLPVLPVGWDARVAASLGLFSRDCNHTTSVHYTTNTALSKSGKTQVVFGCLQLNKPILGILVNGVRWHAIWITKKKSVQSAHLNPSPHLNALLTCFASSLSFFNACKTGCSVNIHNKEKALKSSPVQRRFLPVPHKICATHWLPTDSGKPLKHARQKWG